MWVPQQGDKSFLKMVHDLFRIGTLASGFDGIHGNRRGQEGVE